MAYRFPRIGKPLRDVRQHEAPETGERFVIARTGRIYYANGFDVAKNPTANMFKSSAGKFNRVVRTDGYVCRMSPFRLWQGTDFPSAKEVMKGFTRGQEVVPRGTHVAN